MDQQRQENLALRADHKTEIQQTRDQVMQIRSGLTAEFQTQLDQIVLSEVKTQLSLLPDKARTALGEKELLKM